MVYANMKKYRVQLSTQSTITRGLLVKLINYLWTKSNSVLIQIIDYQLNLINYKFINNKRLFFSQEFLKDWFMLYNHSKIMNIRDWNHKQDTKYIKTSFQYACQHIAP